MKVLLKYVQCVSRVVAMLVVFFFVTAAAHAQTTGIISGVASDKGGAVIPGVQVTAKNTATGELRTAVTNKAGEYSFPSLKPGDYAITFTLTGFATIIETATLNVTEHIAVSTQMQVGSTDQTVEVTAQEPLLQTESITQGRVIDGTSVQELPLATNNFTQLLALSPGVTGELNDATGLGRGTQNINSNGARTSSNSIYIDGIDAVNVHVNSAANNSFASNGTIIPPTAAIQEFKVQTALFDATTGRSGGSNISLITRSGGNQIHGQVYEYFRNELFAANTYFLKSTGQRRPKLRQNQFGAAIGGPFIKDKLYGFFNYQGTRQVNGYAASSTSSLTLPLIPQDRSLASLGAFGNSLGRTSYTGPTIAANGSNISPVAFALLNYKLANGQYAIPSPQIQTAGIVNYAVSVPSTFDEDEYTGSMDYQLGKNDHLAFHTVIAEQPQFQAVPMTLSVPGFGLNQRFKSRLYSAAETHIFSPNVVNELRIGVSRLLGHTTFENQIPLSSIGMTKFNSGDFPYIPLIQLSGAFALGYSVNADQADTENTYQYFDNVSWLKGKHNMNFGVEMRRYQDNYFSNNRQAGTVDIISFQNFLLGQNGTTAAQGGNGTGRSDIYTYSIASGIVQRYDRIRDVALFATDNWKPTQRLTIHLGLRWEYIGLPTDIYGRNGAFDPRRYQAPGASGLTSLGFVQNGNALNPVPGIAKVSNTLTDNIDKLNFGPRAGLALQITPKILFRGGYGLFYDRLSNQLGLLESLSLPNYIRADAKNSTGTVTNKTASTPININSSLDNPFPTLPLRSQFPVIPTLTAYSPTSTSQPVAINDIDPKLRTPYYQQYAANFQLQILKSMMYEVGYVGARGLHLPVETEINQALLASASNPVNGATSNTTDAQQRAPYQGFSVPGLLFLQTNHVSNFNSLQNTLTMNKGRSNALFTYTYGKSLDTASGTRDGSVFTTTTGDQTDQSQAYGPSDFDRTHHFAGRFVYSFGTPHFGFLKGKMGRRVFGGYQLSGTTIFQSGRPVDIESASGATYYGTDTSRGDLAPGRTSDSARKTGRTEGRLAAYFDTTAFQSAGTYYGTIGRNTLRGPFQRNIDVTLAKRTRVFDNASLLIRAEAFNIFNWVNFANPSGNVDSAAAFGKITSTTANPRILQFTAKIEF